MFKIFPKINFKFYFNITTHNQTYEYIFITTHFILNNKDYHSYHNFHSVY